MQQYPKNSSKVAIPAIQRLQPKSIGQSIASKGSTITGGLVFRARKSRKSAPKTKNGCQTCKIRHKKCDEKKPACDKCLSSGRKCDFLEHRTVVVPATSSETLALSSQSSRSTSMELSHPASPLPSFELTAQDSTFYQYFIDQSTHGFLGAIVNGSHIWKLFLQATHSEPCIRHIAVATAIMHKLNPYISNNPSDTQFITYYHSALRHYAISIKCLRERLNAVQGKADLLTWQLSMIAALLFTSFEVLIGNEEGAHWQNLNGLKLMKSGLKTYQSSADQLNLPGDLRELTLAFNKRDIQGATFGLGYEPQVLLDPVVPDVFTKWDEAATSLDTLIPNILSLARKFGPEWYKDPNIIHAEIGNLDSEFSRLKSMLQKWFIAFKIFLTMKKSIVTNDFVDELGVQELVSKNTLLIQYWTSFIWLHTPYSASQYIHDPYSAQFTNITDLAEEILTIVPERRFRYSTDNELVHPLFYVAQKCRDGTLRRRAVELLKISGREGVWDGQCVAAAARWIIEKEEEGLNEGNEDNVMGSLIQGERGFVEEKFRLRGSFITVNRLAKELHIAATRIDGDGNEYWISGDVGWGEIKYTVVYGESGKLWQKGLLFG